MVTRRPRALRRLPRLDAVRPFPREEATPPVTNTCLVGVPLFTEFDPTGCAAGNRHAGRRIQCVSGKAEEGDVAEPRRPTTTPPGACWGGARRTGLGLASRSRQWDRSVRTRRTEGPTLNCQRSDQGEHGGDLAERGIGPVDGRGLLGRSLPTQGGEVTARGRGGGVAGH